MARQPQKPQPQQRGKASQPAQQSRSSRASSRDEERDPKRNATPRNAVQTRAASPVADVPEHLADMMDEDAGKGLSSDPSDNLVPLMVVLQGLSPQVQARNEAYIDGAEPGDIYLKGSEDPLHKEVWFQPCHFSIDWVEWIPRKQGGGLVARHKTRPADAKQVRDPERPQVLRWKSSSGNDLVETRYYAGYVIFDDGRPAEAYTMPLSSTGHSFGKLLMTQMNKRVTKNGNRAPSFATMWRLGTIMKSNNAGDWYSFAIQDAQWVQDRDQYIAGRLLQEAFEANQMTAELDTSDTGGDSDPDGRM